MSRAGHTEALVEQAGRAAEAHPEGAAPEMTRLAEYALEAARACRWDPRKQLAYLLAAEGYARAALRAAESSTGVEAA
jgi:hypothetical protein